MVPEGLLSSPADPQACECETRSGSTPGALGALPGCATATARAGERAAAVTAAHGGSPVAPVPAASNPHRHAVTAAA